MLLIYFKTIGLIWMKIAQNLNNSLASDIGKFGSEIITLKV